MIGAGLAQRRAQVGEVLDVTALIGRDRYAVGVLLDGGADNVGHAAIVAQVDHLGALRLQDAAHDGDGRVVSIEEARGGDETQGSIGHSTSRCAVL